MLHFEQVQQDSFWNFMREIRVMNVFTQEDIECSKDSDCILFTEKMLKKNNFMMETKLGMTSNYKILENVKKETLQLAAEMFTYLNFCPKKLDSVLMYQQIFKKATAKDILLALNSIRRKSTSFDKNIVEQVWSFVTNKLNITSYKKLKSYTNESFSVSATWTLDMPLKGKQNSTSSELLMLFAISELGILGRVFNHPVHIEKINDEWTPSALIPFCEFGRSMSVMGNKIDQFGVPVCNSFKSKIYKDQLCYSVDPNIYRDSIQSKELSLILAIDYNEDRQFLYNKKDKKQTKNKGSFEGNAEKSSAFVIVETIGTILTSKFKVENISRSLGAPLGIQLQPQQC